MRYRYDLDIDQVLSQVNGKKGGIGRSGLVNPGAPILPLRAKIQEHRPVATRNMLLSGFAGAL
jgi:hypothetical protein